MVGISPAAASSSGAKVTVCPALEPERLRPACRRGCGGPAGRAARRPASRRAAGHLAELLDPARADLGRAVRGVDADDVDAGVEQRGHLRGLLPRGAERGDDLGAANRSAGHGRESNAGPSPLHHDLAADDGERAPARAHGVAGAALGGGIEVDQATRSASRPGASVPARAGHARRRAPRPAV